MAVINIGCEQGCRSYPCTLPRTTLSRGALRLLHRALVGSKSPYGELDLFDDDGSHAITAWDLPSPTDGRESQHHAQLPAIFTTVLADPSDFYSLDKWQVERYRAGERGYEGG